MCSTSFLVSTISRSLARQLAIYSQIGPLFVDLTWLVTGISEGKKRFFASQKYVEPHDLMGAFLCTIGSYYFHPLSTTTVYIAAQLQYISWLMHQFDTLCVYTSIAIGVVILCIFKTTTINKCTYEPACQQLHYTDSQAWYIIIKCVPQHQIKTRYATSLVSGMATVLAWIASDCKSHSHNIHMYITDF